MFSINNIDGVISYVDKKVLRNEFSSLLIQDTGKYNIEGYYTDLSDLYEDYEKNYESLYELTIMYLRFLDAICYLTIL